MFLRMVVTQSKIDTMTTAEIQAIQNRYRDGIDRLFKYAADGTVEPGQFAKRVEQLKTEARIVDLIAEDLASSSGAVGAIAYEDYNAMLSWDGKIPGYNEIARSALEIKEQVMVQSLGGKILSEWIDDSMAANLADGFERSRQLGLGYQDMVVQVAKDFTEQTEADLITLARTYNQTIAVKAHTDVFEANPDIVNGITWTAVLENGNYTTGTGTCLRCAALDGKDYDSKNDAPSCPLHPRCRCLLLPRTKTWRELGFDVDEMERAYRPWVIRTEDAIDAGGKRHILDVGQGKYKDYADFWASQDEAFQNGVVGIQRARGIRNDFFSFDDIIDKRGEVVPIAKMGLSDDERYFMRTGRWPLDKKPPPVPKPPPIVPPVTPGTGPAPGELANAAGFTKSRDVMAQMDALEYNITKDPEYVKLGTRYAELKKQESEIYAKINSSKDLRVRERIIRTELNPILGESKIVANQMREFRRVEQNKAIRPPAGGKIEWEKFGGSVDEGKTGWDLIEKKKKKFDKMFAETAEMFHPDLLDRLPPVSLSFKTRSRAHYANKDKWVNNNDMDNIQLGDYEVKTLVHEYGHHVELRAGLYERFEAFLQMRRGTEKLSPIKGRKNEMGYKDKFFDHYVGRVYSEETKSTEIVSMGLERMYDDPMGFYKDDPEHFELILQVMWGEL